MRGILALVFLIVAFAGAGYISIWLGVVQPILIITAAIDAGTITATLVGGQFLWFFFRGLFAVLWAAIWLGASKALVGK